jgi:hypothetical protein
MSAVERAGFATAVLKASVKLFDSGGPDAQAAWEAVEKAREAYIACNKREQICWRKVIAPADQTEIPGTEAPGANYAGPKMLPQAGNLLDAAAEGE